MSEESEGTVMETPEELMARIQKLESNNNRLLDEKKQMGETLNKERAGKKQVIDKMKTAEEKRLIETGDFDTLIQMKSQQILQAKDDALRDSERKIDELSRQNETMHIGSLARDAAARSGVRPEAAEEVQLIVRDRFKSVDGQLVGYDHNGNELLNDKGMQMSISEYIQSLAPTKGYLFSPTQGGGAHGGNGSQQSGIKRSDMTTEQKSAYVAKHGESAYLGLPS